MNLEQAEALGFDRSEQDGEYVRIRCGSCEALVINGVPCHETGCRQQTHECEECMTLVPKSQRLCESCANPDDGPEPEATYSIVRHRFKGGHEVIDTGKTLQEAQDWCERDDTHGEGWFDGYAKED